jgi:hypothetical protein
LDDNRSLSQSAARRLNMIDARLARSEDLSASKKEI